MLNRFNQKWNEAEYKERDDRCGHAGMVVVLGKKLAMSMLENLPS